jgi:hypothetical protein
MAPRIRFGWQDIGFLTVFMLGMTYKMWAPFFEPLVNVYFLR